MHLISFKALFVEKKVSVTLHLPSMYLIILPLSLIPCHPTLLFLNENVQCSPYHQILLLSLMNNDKKNFVSKKKPSLLSVEQKQNKSQAKCLSAEQMLTRCASMPRHRHTQHELWKHEMGKQLVLAELDGPFICHHANSCAQWAA